MTNKIKYIISTHLSKFAGYQSKKQHQGEIKLFVSNIYEMSDDFDDFIVQLIYIQLIERVCIELAFNKLKIQGGKCNNCRPRQIVNKIMDLLF